MLVTDAVAFRRSGPELDAGRCVAEYDGPASVLAANPTATAAATHMPPILSQCRWRNTRIAS
jgi:hypothetical protein